MLIALLSVSFSFSQNPIVTENALAGTPKSTWDISGAGDLSIQGFATDMSVNKGQTIRFKIETSPVASYTITIYRLGYYQGNGARLIANLGTFAGTNQPDGSSNSSTGLLDCANWSESASWAVPATAVSGLYIAKLTKTSGGGSSHITFVVRDDASTSAMLFKTSDATWQAYNVYGGNSLYVGATSYPAGHVAKVSYNRPFITRNGGGGGGAMEDWYMNAEFPMIRFLERNGYDITYTTDVDMDRDASAITPANHKVILSVGHDEYWSLAERTKFENARAAGVHLAFFSGNEVYWKTRWENNNRTLVCYKEGTLGENVCGNKCDPTSAWTGLWRDGAAYDGGKPENALTGQISWENITTAIQVPAAYKNLRFWRGIPSINNLAANAKVTFPNGTLGYEADLEQYPDNYPSGRITLSSTPINGNTHKLSLYRHPSGALVFGAGSVQWSWGLDNIHDRGSAAASVPMQQATVNLFADMGVQPGSIMSGLTLATASTDFTAPACVITSPAHGAALSTGSNVTISGTATDAGGVLVGIEVSVDGGATWQDASGTSSWTFSWTPTLPGSINIKVRGFDDSGNMSVPGANGSSNSITVTVGGSNPVCPCNIFSSSSIPAIQNDSDGQPIELGVKFRATQSGYITGIRFYKGSSNTGTHIGHLWSSTGTKLAEATFVSETSSGWQQVLFTSPVAISANTTYVASYLSSSGYYSNTNPYFTTAIVNGFLRGLANGEDGVNGVYVYTATGAFPTNNFQTSNYWVDVVYQTTVTPDVTPPAINLTAPAAGTVSGTINVTANASDNIGVAGVQFLLDGVSLGAEDVAAPYSVAWTTTTATNGNHNLTARARDAAGNQTTSSVIVVNVSNVADTELPVTSLTAPAAGTVSGTVNVAANATDNIGVVGVQFLLNGVNLGTEDIAAPYTVSWNTIGTANGNYTLTARARDAAGNLGNSTPVVVTVFNNNLVLALGFSQGSGTTATDNSGNNNNGTLTNGPAWSASGKYGSAVLFDGTDDFINIPDASSIDLTNGMTMEAWVNPSNVTGFKTIICKDRTTSNYTYTLAANNNTTTVANQRPSSRLRIGSANQTVTGTSKLALNTWTHVASTYDGATFRLYVNGVQVSSLAVTGNITVTTDPLRIGGTTALSGQYFAGLIDEVRIYNRALTQAEIQTDMNTPVAPDVINPTVSITAPAAGNVSGTLNVTATAADNISVTGVQFLLDGVNLGTEDLAAPYTASWNTLTATNGTHTLTARARDAAGNTAASTAVIVTVNNDIELPIATITAPIAGIVNGTINVNADASDNVAVAGVQFLLNGVNLGAEDITAPYSVSWNTTAVADGNYTLTARARDAAGNTGTSAPVVVTVQNTIPDTQSPLVDITAPVAGEVSGTLNVTANASDNIAVTGVQFFLNGANLGIEDVVAPYSISWNTTTLANGNYTLTAAARDAAGNTTTSAGVIVTVNNLPDVTPPVVSITAPAAGTVTGTINVTANASDNIDVAGVQFLLNGINLGAEDVAAPYSISWNTVTSANGIYTLTAVARDAAGNIATATGVIAIINNDTEAPAVSITAPAAGTVTGTINVTANASDNMGVVGVQFLLNGVNLSAEDVAAPYSISWNTVTSTNGTYTLTAVARDAAGNTTVSTGVIVTVSNITNLIVALPLNEGTGTAATDISGKTHPGTLTNAPTWGAGKYGQGVNLDGTNDYINIADHADFTLDPAQSYTWSAWVKNTNFREWSTVWSQTINTSNFFYFYAHTSTDPDGGPVTNGVSAYWWTSGGTNKIGAHSANNVLTAGQWSHIAVTYNASQPQNNRFTIYVNGVDVTVRTDMSSTGTLTTINPTNIRVGSNQAFGEYLTGSVDEVRFYNRLLSTTEVQADMNTPLGTGIIARVSTPVQLPPQPQKAETPGRMFDVIITPNPSADFFNLVVISDEKEPVTVNIMDISGRVVENHRKVTSKSLLRLGETWKTGTYFAEVIHGSQRKVVKIIKVK